MNESASFDATTYVGRLKNVLDNLDLGQIEQAIASIDRAWRGGRQVVTFGNGGSALTSPHHINDWNKSIYLASGIPFEAEAFAKTSR